MSANNDAVNLQPGPPSVHAVLGKLWEAAGLDRGAAQRLTATGSEPVLRRTTICQRIWIPGLNRCRRFNYGVAVRTALRSMLLLVVSACATTTAVSPDAAIQQVAAASDSWRAACDSREPERIVAMYAADAALWGTNLRALATTPAATKAY